MNIQKHISLACLCLVAMAQSAAAQDYELYAVKPSDTLESLRMQQKVTLETFFRLNPSLRSAPFPAAGTIIFLPVPKVEPKIRPTLSSRSSTVREANADRKSVSPEVHSTKEPSHETELSAQDVDALYESLVTPIHGRGREMALDDAPLMPSHQNTMMTSDGTVISVPQARRRPKPVAVETSPSRHSLSSRRGLRARDILKESLKFMGVPYVWGGTTPSGFDCSGYVQYVFARQGVALPRTADLQFEVGKVIKHGEEQPGDLVFFETYCPGPSHIGIYLGRHQFVHASSAAAQIRISDLREEHFQRCYLGAKRVW
jgi:cell wall-associated NlpC family hydrolase